MAGVTPFNSSVQPLETSDPSAGVHISSREARGPAYDGIDPLHPEHVDCPRYGSRDHDPGVAPILYEESAFRHSGWASDRRRVFDAMRRCHEPERRLSAFADCGSSAWGHWCEGEPVVTCNHCHDRLCQPCQVARRARLVEAIMFQVAGASDRIRFLTFTLKHNDTPLADQLDRLYLAFRTLRRRPLWRTQVTGGALFLEVKVGKDGRYHPHLHVLAEGGWLDQKALSADWHAVTGDSYIVDVRRVDDPRSRASYVSKYATKPADSSIIRVPDKLDEFILAIKGRRLYQPFGAWRALMPSDDDNGPERRLVPLGSIYTICARAAAGCHASRMWWSMATAKWPHLSVFAPHPTHTNTDPAPP